MSKLNPQSPAENALEKSIRELEYILKKLDKAGKLDNLKSTKEQLADV